MTLAQTIQTSLAITIQIGNILNPGVAISTQSFGIQIGSQSQTNGIILSFDEDSFVGIATLTTGSNKAYEINQYTFTFEPKNIIPAGGTIQITIPSSVSYEVSDPA